MYCSTISCIIRPIRFFKYFILGNEKIASALGHRESYNSYSLLYACYTWWSAVCLKISSLTCIIAEEILNYNSTSHFLKLRYLRHRENKWPTKVNYFKIRTLEALKIMSTSVISNLFLYNIVILHLNLHSPTLSFRKILKEHRYLLLSYPCFDHDKIPPCTLKNGIFQHKLVISSYAKITRVPDAIWIILVFALRFLIKIT